MAQNDRYQWLFRKNPALTVALDDDGYFLDASDAWLARFGYARDEITDWRTQDLASPESARRIEDE
jgi:PAS domain S-box-containing protein